MITHRVAATRDFLSPLDRAWEAVTADDVTMMATPLGMQPTEYVRKAWEQHAYGQVRSLSVASVHDGRTWAARIRWRGVAPGGRDFPDAVAIALPVSGKPPLVSMGAPEAPIHILRWQANREGVRSLVATGIGRSRPGPELERGATAHAEGDVWSVVVIRALGAPAETAPLLAGRQTQIGFAVWQGGNDERAGIKAFSIDWLDLVLDA